MKGTSIKEPTRPETSFTRLRSEALRVNLQATDRDIVIDPKYLPLVEVVESLPGLYQQAEGFLHELNHPFKNWAYVVQEMRNYALRNFCIYYTHAQGPKVVEIILNEWLDALNCSPDPQVHGKALDNIVSFIEKLVDDGKSQLRFCLPILARVFDRLTELPEDQLFLLASGYYQVKRIGHLVLDLGEAEFDHLRFNRLLRRNLQTTYQYWLSQEDPAAWFTRNGQPSYLGSYGDDLFLHIRHSHVQAFLEALARIDQSKGPKSELADLLRLPAYMEIVASYKELPQRIEEIEGDPEERLDKTLQAWLKIVESRGLTSIHEYALGKLNRCFGAIVHSRKVENVDELFNRTFVALKQSMQKFPEAAIQALENMGREVFRSNDSDMVDQFIQHTIDLGFQCPEVKGTTREWKVQVNPAHLANIKAWLHLIENDPKWSKRLISALIINLKLGGLYFKDTDLFQKEISRFLNSGISPVYNLAKQLAKLFPVYYNEINAEGAIRDVSTEIDEISQRRDILIHFLRKQSHVESNNLLIDFALAIFDFWRRKDKTPLVPYLPPEILDRVCETGLHVDGVNRLVNELFEKTGLEEASSLLDLDMAEVERHLDGSKTGREEDRQRVLLLVKFLGLLDHKYNLTRFNTTSLLKEAALKGLPRTEHLEKALKSPGLIPRLQGILDYLKLLKQIILSPEEFTVAEDIYRKRHIAADIPSLYGTYHEKKFDALGFTFRLENLANVYFEKLISYIDLTFLTRTTFFQIIDCMHLLVQAMEVDGITVRPLKDVLDLLTRAVDVRRFTFTQYMDILRQFSRTEQHVLNTHYTSIHKENLGAIIQQLGGRNLLPRYHVGRTEKISADDINKTSEAFFRDTVATTFGFQYLDNFVSRVIDTLSRQSEELSRENLDLLLSFDPGKSLSGIHRPLRAIQDPIYLGGKGHKLARLCALRMRVPHGFVITTEVFRCLPAIRAFKQADQALREKILRQIRLLEKETRRRFGDPANPLLLSIRSGAALSMPGMMNTFLNVGVNEAIVEGLVTKTAKPWFAWDNYRRFLQSWGMSYGMDRNVFDAIMKRYKGKYGVERKRQFSPPQMRELTLAYRQALFDASVFLTEDPYEQLFEAIRQVCLSWDSKQAKTYRDIMGISDDWGTAVIVQNMIYGNLHTQAGSGVVFTHNPHASLDKVALWGDYTIGGQGEDVVSGLVRTEAISLEQKKAETRDHDQALEDTFPEIFEALRNVAKTLVYDEGWGAQEIEFTFEGPTADKLYLLQTRDMVVRHRARYPVFVHSPQLKDARLAKGVGVSGGALSGRAVFSLDDIRHFRTEEPERSLILIRFDTVPDDIREISAADGLLTSRGGATSHASIVAHQLEKTCVVGCSKLMVYEEAGRCVVNGHDIRRGDFLSIDGQNGLVYKGRQEIQLFG